MTVAEVILWGRTIGAVSWDDERNVAFFEYAPAFQQSNIPVAPLTMPLGPTIYSFPELKRETFYGLPGLLADTLPDRFGNAVIDAWLARQGRSSDSFNPVERLCYIGKRGMGALEFEPARPPKKGERGKLDVQLLVELASEILARREALKGSFESPKRERTMQEIFRIGTSAGGARAKAVVAWNPETNEVRSGQLEPGSGFSHWIIKFDGVSGNRDKELEDPLGYGLIEYAYYKMATAAGIDMSDCAVLSENGRHHFMTNRFDRTDESKKLHMQSLAGIAHYDFNLAGGYAYEQAFQVMRKLDLTMAELEQQFRRMVFNIVARNQDDHVKNIAYLMDKAGNWSLSPAYDVTYSYNPDGDWTNHHQMTLNGKRDRFTREDFTACEKAVVLKRGRGGEILAEVSDTVKRWRSFAAEAGVPDQLAERIAGTHRLTILD